MLTLLFLLKPCLILDLGRLEIFQGFSYSNFDCEIQQGQELHGKIEICYNYSNFLYFKGSRKNSFPGNMVSQKSG